jgi:hypothetical protein
LYLLGTADKNVLMLLLLYPSASAHKPGVITHGLCHWSLTWWTRPPPPTGVGKYILGRPQKHLTLIKTKQRNRLNLEIFRILSHTKIRPLAEVLPCQIHSQSTQWEFTITLIIDRIFII